MGICGKKREIYETTSGSYLFLAIFLLEHCWWGWRGMTPMLPSRMCYWAVLYMLPVTHIYRPPTECRRLCFQICLSFCPRGAGPMWPLPMMHCTSLFSLTPPNTAPALAPLDPPPLALHTGPWHVVATTEACTVGKRVARILLECF